MIEPKFDWKSFDRNKPITNPCELIIGMTLKECVEKQVPMKIKQDKHKFYICPRCQNELYWDTDYGQQKFAYCPDCGQAIDWSEEE